MKITKLIKALERVKAKQGEDVNIFLPEIIDGVQLKGSLYGVSSLRVLTATPADGSTPKTLVRLNKYSKPRWAKAATAGK